MRRSSVITPLTPELVRLLQGTAADLTKAADGMRPADIAESLHDLSPEAAAEFLAALPFDAAVRVFDEPELDNRYEIIKHVDAAKVGQLIDAMSSDQQADLFRELSEPDRAQLLAKVGPPTREAMTLLLRYPPETAGGIMTTELVSVPASWTVGEILRHIGEVGRVKETVYAVYVTNPEDRRLERVMSLRELVSADPQAQIGEVADKRPPLSVGPLTTRLEAARIISKYDLLALPVVDDAGHVIGIVTVDDVIDAMVRETTKEVQRLGGMEALDDPYTDIGFWEMIKKRAGWLTALFLGEMLTATAMGHFEGEIERAVVLALFVPLIISSGGNSGSQATSLIIRALALRELTLRDWWRVAMRELPSGLTLGAILGIVGVIRIVVWQQLGWYDYGTHWALVAITVGLALVGVVLFGCLAGSMLPFVLKRFGFDPASASAPFVATLVDVTGLVIYFSVAATILRGTLL